MCTPPTVNQCSLGFVAQKMFEEVATPAKFRPEGSARRPKNTVCVPFCTSPVPDLVEHRTRKGHARPSLDMADRELWEGWG